MKKLNLLVIILIVILINIAHSTTIKIYVYGEGGIIRDGNVTIICPKTSSKICAILEWDLTTSIAKVYDENKELIEEIEMKSLKSPNGFHIDKE